MENRLLGRPETREAWTQEDLDEIVRTDDGHGFVVIRGGTPLAPLRLRSRLKNRPWAIDDACVIVSNDAWIKATDNAIIRAYDRSDVTGYDNAMINARDKARVTLHDHAHATTNGRVRLKTYAHSKAHVYGCERCCASGYSEILGFFRSHINLTQHSRAWLFQNSRGFVEDQTARIIR